MADAVARRSYGKLVALLAARTGDVAAAEDALSEAFVSALAKLAAERLSVESGSLALTVARRKVIDLPGDGAPARSRSSSCSSSRKAGSQRRPTRTFRIIVSR